MKPVEKDGGRKAKEAERGERGGGENSTAFVEKKTIQTSTVMGSWFNLIGFDSMMTREKSTFESKTN